MVICAHVDFSNFLENEQQNTDEQNRSFLVLAQNDFDFGTRFVSGDPKNKRKWRKKTYSFVVTVLLDTIYQSHVELFPRRR